MKQYGTRGGVNAIVFLTRNTRPILSRFGVKFNPAKPQFQTGKFADTFTAEFALP